MRIITGSVRGRRLRAPAGLRTRPILDRQKQMLFDVLADRVRVDGVWDLFAGSGGLGLEALSRGAEACTFVESDPEALACLRANVAACRFESRAHVVAADALRLDLARCRPDAGLVFVDPPFEFVAARRDALEALLSSLARSSHVLPGATIVWRIPTKTANVAMPEALVAVDERSAGRSVVLLYEKRG